jgi:transposase
MRLWTHCSRVRDILPLMVATRATLPDLNTLDRDVLQSILLATHERFLAQHEELIAAQEQLLVKEEQLLSRVHEIEHLKLLIAKLRRLQFGRKSEKVERQIEQLELKLEDLEAQRVGSLPQPACEADGPKPAPNAKSRRPLPEHLPRETRTHAPAEPVCPACGGTLKKLGEDVSEVLEWVPASFKVIRHVRPKLCCAGCDKIVQAPAPSRPIDRGLAGPGLLAHVLTSKFADHLPLYRQSEIYAREGVDLDRSTLAKWVGEASHLLAPLVEALRRYVMSADKLHADDTPVPVLAPGNGRTKTGRLWTYVRDDRPSGSNAAPAAWFAYSPDRKGEHPQRHLSNFRGILQADAYSGFNQLYADGSIQEAPCLAHIRRKFYDLMEAHRSPIATEAVERIGALYGIEKEIRGRPPDERREVRNTRSRPLLNAMRAWLETSLPKLSQKSDTSAAIHYALARWDTFARYCGDGRIEIDNSAAERALRAVAVGRKNYLFAGSDAGGERAATFYCLLGTAKLNGLNPEAYLRQVLERIADHPVNRIAELLPWNLGLNDSAAELPTR